MPRISFLHTAPVHVQNFDALLRELAPDTAARHEVREDLLTEARCRGADDPAVIRAVGEAVAALAADGDVVLCTCSTIGAAAEDAGNRRGATVLRIDRPMAEEALRLGPRIVVAAALASTIAPTMTLLDEIARDRNIEATITPLLLEPAWQLFESGDVTGYHRFIAQALVAVRDADAIVLAQASMAGAIEWMEASTAAARGHGAVPPVLSSPLLGVRAAVARL